MRRPLLRNTSSATCCVKWPDLRRRPRGESPPWPASDRSPSLYPPGWLAGRPPAQTGGEHKETGVADSRPASRSAGSAPRPPRAPLRLVPAGGRAPGPVTAGPAPGAIPTPGPVAQGSRFVERGRGLGDSESGASMPPWAISRAIHEGPGSSLGSWDGFPPRPAGYRVVEKKRTVGPIFGSPAAGTPVRRGGALVHRPAPAGPPRPARTQTVERGVLLGGL
jgi:hypothetical protein